MSIPIISDNHPQHVGGVDGRHSVPHPQGVPGPGLGGEVQLPEAGAEQQAEHGVQAARGNLRLGAPPQQLSAVQCDLCYT